MRYLLSGVFISIFPLSFTLGERGTLSGDRRWFMTGVYKVENIAIAHARADSREGKPGRVFIYWVVVTLGFLLLALSCPASLAQTRGELEPSWDLFNLLFLVVIEPLLPLVTGAGLFVLTRSYRISAGLVALGFGAWGALHFARLSLDGPLWGALYGFGTEGVISGILALLGSGYVHLIQAEAYRLGSLKTAIVHGVGIAFAATAFVLFLVTNGSDKVGNGLYLFVVAWSFGAATATGSFGGVVATMAVAPRHGTWRLGRSARLRCQ